ncbi:hypothetical protein [uncultured Flavobacterium sp.]|uniref:hypothetical protein n=1 Tax=uncultured Flavobacterium sp. TaxID=165435 RepID=UPI0030C8908C
MKTTFIIILFLSISSCIYAQEIKLKKETIYIDGKAVLSYEKKSYGNELVIYELNTKNELITDVYNPTSNYQKIFFIKQKKSMEMRPKYWNKSLIKWFIEQDILDVNGNLNEEKVDIFIEKFDEKITERTIIKD